MSELFDTSTTRRLIEETRDGVAVYDNAARLLLWNPAARAITGWDTGSAQAAHLLALPDGMTEIRAGKWVELRRFSASVKGKALTTLVFTNATVQMELRDARRQLSDGGLVDEVTQLPDRRVALAHLGRAIALARRDSRSAAVLAIGVDGLAPFRDGRVEQGMRQAALRLTSAIRSSDLAARVGPEEFAVVLTAMSNPLDSSVVATRLLMHLARPIIVLERERTATVSIGSAVFPIDAAGPIALWERAHEAQEAAAKSGGGVRATETA